MPTLLLYVRSMSLRNVSNMVRGFQLLDFDGVPPAAQGTQGTEEQQPVRAACLLAAQRAKEWLQVRVAHICTSTAHCTYTVHFSYCPTCTSTWDIKSRMLSCAAMQVNLIAYPNEHKKCAVVHSSWSGVSYSKLSFLLGFRLTLRVHLQDLIIISAGSLVVGSLVVGE